MRCGAVRLQYRGRPPRNDHRTAGGWMTFNEVIDLLVLRDDYNHVGYRNSTKKAWAEALEGVPKGHAVVAMRRACVNHKGKDEPTFGQFIEELAAYEHGLRNRGDEAEERRVEDDCADCHGTGWREAPSIERWGLRYSQGEPCSHTGRKLGNEPIPYEQGLAIMRAAAEAERRGRRATVGLPADATSEQLWEAERQALRQPRRGTHDQPSAGSA